MDELLFFILVGLCAQLIDGTLGMAYGVSATSILLSMGVSPALASASVHTAEVFTTGVSGLSHFKLGNVDKTILKKLVIPGVLGGLLGVYVLVNVNSTFLKPIISFYLLLMGGRILWKALRKAVEQRERHTNLIVLGLFGGIFDAIGGGGWGPIVTTTLIANGKNPRTTIGSVNLSEFFVTFAEATAFIFTIGLTGAWQVVLGLIIGGVIAAPMGAFFAKRVPTRALMMFVGSLIILLSIRTILLSLPDFMSLFTTLSMALGG